MMLTKKHKYKNSVRLNVAQIFKNLPIEQKKRNANEVRFHQEVEASLVLSKDGGCSVDLAVMKCRRSRGYEKETNYKVPLATNNLAG